MNYKRPPSNHAPWPMLGENVPKDVGNGWEASYQESLPNGSSPGGERLVSPFQPFASTSLTTPDDANTPNLQRCVVYVGDSPRPLTQDCCSTNPHRSCLFDKTTSPADAGEDPVPGRSGSPKARRGGLATHQRCVRQWPIHPARRRQGDQQSPW